MKPSWLQSRFKLRLLLAFFVTGCVHATEPVFSDPQLNNNVTGNTGQATQPGIKDPAMVIHIDPKTGKIIVPSKGALPGQVPQSALDTSKKPLPDLPQTLSPVPGGGVVIHLDERFMNPLTATIDAEGKVRHEHKQTMSGSDEK